MLHKTKSLKLSFCLALSLSACSACCNSGGAVSGLAFTRPGAGCVLSAMSSLSKGSQQLVTAHHCTGSFCCISTFQRRRQRTILCALETDNNEQSDSKTIEGSMKVSDSQQQMMNMAILLPEPIAIADTDSRGSDSQWHLQSIRKLKETATKFGLPIINTMDWGNDDNEQQEIDNQHASHYLTAVPYPHANTYALAIHNINSPALPKSNNNRRRNSSKRKKKIKLGDPVFVDLCPPPDTRLGYRINKGDNSGGGGELLIKALGMKKIFCETTQDKESLVLYDLTAGLARDSLIILSSFIDLDRSQLDGAKMRLHMVERNPIVALLLLDAMRRLDLLANATGDEEDNTARKIADYLSIEEGDGVSVSNRLMADSSLRSKSSQSQPKVPYPPDICYLDPMFPPRKNKSSAVKKDMAMLHSLLGTSGGSGHGKNDTENNNSPTEMVSDAVRIKEEQELLLAAYNIATRRVVVKRPIGAQPIGLPSAAVVDDDKGGSINGANIPKPSYDVRGSINRFDVYIIS